MSRNERELLVRRSFLKRAGATGLLVGVERLAPAYAWQMPPAEALSQGEKSIDLLIGRRSIPIAGRSGKAITINGSVPGPLVRLREGRIATIRVTNHLGQDASIHWHGMLVPTHMDGVPHVSYPGIKPGETFTYRYPVRQSGTYWYHSHSGLQEQSGVYGPMIVDPIEPEPFRYDRDYVVMLSDWTFADPYRVLAKLKRQSDYYNFQRRTVADFYHDVSAKGWRATVADRLTWARSRMDPTDISDVTGYRYTYLVNGLAPGANWTALFRSGERVRLRFINGSSMTYFDVRIPGLKLTVVQADGQNVRPVIVDEFRIAVAETYDVIVEPQPDSAYTIFAEAIDRSGYARGTLAPREGMSAAIPHRRPRPLRTMKDMGMPPMGMKSMPGVEMKSMPGMERKSMPMKSGHNAGMAQATEGGVVPSPRPATTMHGPDHHGPGNSMVAMMPSSRLDEPGDGQ